jgi:hypothetical protein
METKRLGDPIFIGERYEETKDLSVKEIARLIRKDIALDIGNVLPSAMRCSVRVEYYSGGCTLWLTVRKMPKQPACHLIETKNRVVERLRYIANRYQRDASDIQADYFNVRFFERIIFSCERL